VYDEVERLKTLEVENVRLKKQVARGDLEIEMMKEITAKNGEHKGSARRRALCDIAPRTQRRRVHCFR
jgi:hypothetical protein